MTTDVKKILKIFVLSVFFLFIIIYGFSRSQDLIFGIKIKNVNIIDGAPARTTAPRQNDSVGLESGGKVVNNIIEVTGNAENAINLTLNGREITIDSKGNFNETIALLSGYNIINITAKDKFGYIDEKNYKLIR